jgi:histidine triad (HIT) family protein
MNDCVFCKVVSGGISARHVYAGKNLIGFLDMNPKTEGHTLIIPKKHYRNMLDMPSLLGDELLTAIKKISLDLIDSGKAEGVNVVCNNESAADQAVFHTHVHIIPRKKGDGLKIWAH